MPLDSQLIRSCPLLLESDWLTLTPDLRQTNLVLSDSAVGTSHAIHQTGSALVARLAQGTSYGQLLVLAAEQNIDSSSVHELLGFLNKLGGLELKRSWRTTWTQAIRKHCLHLLLGVVHPPHRRRKVTSLTNLFRYTLHATTPVILAAGVVAAASWAAGMASPQTAIAIAASYTICLLLSIVGHELGHIKILRHRNISTRLLQDGMRIGIIHRRLSPQLEIMSALVGPLVGAILCLPMAYLAWRYLSPLAALGCCLISSCHLLSLLPLYGDGLSFQKALRQRKYHEKYP